MWTRVTVFVLVFCLILAERAPAQTAKPTSEKKASVETAPEPEDQFGRSTPRSSVAAFFKAFHRENYERAAQYLDSSLELPEREELAYNLGVILDRKLSASLSALSEKPEGNPDDGLAANRDLLGIIPQRVGQCGYSAGPRAAWERSSAVVVLRRELAGGAQGSIAKSKRLGSNDMFPRGSGPGDGFPSHSTSGSLSRFRFC